MTHAWSRRPWEHPLTSLHILALWGGLSFMLGLLFLPISQDLVRAWFSSPTYLHGVIIAPISLYLIWEKRAILKAMTPRPYRQALILAALCGAFILVGTFGGVNIFQHIGLVGLIIALGMLLLGAAISRLIWFPLLYLGFMVPFGAELTPFLQDLTADMVVFFVRLTGIAILRTGLLLETPAGQFFVADACAGLRFLIANIVVSVLFCYFFFTSRRKIAIFLSLAVIIPVIANGLRATAMVVIATFSDMELAVGFDHIVYGWGFFAVILGIQFLIGFKFADPPRALEHPIQDLPPLTLARFFPSLLAFAGMLASIYIGWGYLS